jgi:hypothetical protein
MAAVFDQPSSVVEIEKTSPPRQVARAHKLFITGSDFHGKGYSFALRAGGLHLN